MASGGPCRKPLWQLQFYRKAIGEIYDEKIHWIWVLNKISEVLHSSELEVANALYNDLREAVQKSPKCQEWNFRGKICEIERKSAEFDSQNVLSESFRSSVENEKCNSKKDAGRIHRVLKDLHRRIEKTKKEKVTEWRTESLEADVDYERCKSMLYSEEIEVRPELLEIADEFKIVSPQTTPHACELCDCYYLPECESTPLNLKDRKVVQNCRLKSKNFQGSVRERLQEDFPMLPEGIFCFKSASKKKGSQKTKKQSSKKDDGTKQKATSIAHGKQDNVRGKDKQSDPTCYPESSQLEKGVKASKPVGLNTITQTPVGHVCKMNYNPTQVVKKKKVRRLPSEIEGIDKIVQSFIDFAKHNGKAEKPLVILERYDVADFLKHVKGVRGAVTKVKTDFDVLVISPQIGILCGQIKATTDQARNLLRSTNYASWQCQMSRSVLREMFRDRIDIYDIPVYEFIGLPFVARKALHGQKRDDSGNLVQSKLSQCPLYKNVLTKEDMETTETFSSWLGNISGGAINISNKWAINQEQYWTLLERFVGFGSNMTIVSYPKHTSEIGDKCFQIPLTDEQRELVNRNEAEFRFLTLAGDYGTGKSLILVKKAINIARKISAHKERHGKVIIIACSDICVDGKHLDQKYPEHTVHHLQKLCKGHFENIISVETFGSFTKTDSPDLSGVKGMDLLKKAILDIQESGCELHLMLDEVPAMFVENMQSSECQNVFSDCLNSVSTLWLVVGSHSYRVRRESRADWYVKDCLPHPNFKHVYLNKVLRSPENVFKVSEKISQHCEDDHQGFLENYCVGRRPLLFRVPVCSCKRRGTGEASRDQSVESNPLTCACVEERVTSTLRAVLQEIGIYKNDKMVEDGEKWPGKVTMLVFGVEDDTLFKDLHSLLIKCCKNIAGLHFRNTIMGGRSQRFGYNRAGQINQFASAWGYLGDIFDGSELVDEMEVEVDLQGVVTVADRGSQGDISGSNEEFNSGLLNLPDGEPAGTAAEGVCGCAEGLCVSDGNIQVDVEIERDACCGSDIEESSCDSFVSLGDLRQVLAEDPTCSGDNDTREESHVSREDAMQGNQPEGAVGGCDGASISHEDVSKECKSMKGAIQETQNFGDDSKMGDVDDGSGRPKILLTRTTYFVGCESHVVICVDLNAMKHWFKNTKVAYSTLAVSRCLSQYIHLTWHDEEAEVMFKMNVKALSEDLDSNDHSNIDNAKEHSTLENLLKAGVITEHKVK